MDKQHSQFAVARGPLARDLHWASLQLASVRTEQPESTRRLGPGAALVTTERISQVVVHSYTPAEDAVSCAAGELLDWATGLLLEEVTGPWHKEPRARQIQIAGALLAAELDRRIAAGEAFVCGSCGQLFDTATDEGVVPLLLVNIELPREKVRLCKNCAEIAKMPSEEKS